MDIIVFFAFIITRHIELAPAGFSELSKDVDDASRDFPSSVNVEQSPPNIYDVCYLKLFI